MKHGIKGYTNGCRCDVCGNAISEYGRRRREAHPERVLAIEKCYRQTHRPELAARKRLWREANPGRSAAYNKLHREKVRAELISHLGGRCVQCSTTENLHMDHRDPDTKSERLKGPNRCNIENLPEKERWAEIEKCQLLCAEHHRIKTNSELKGVAAFSVGDGKLWPILSN